MEKKEKGVFIYGFCPGGAFPDGVTLNLLPLQSSLPSCCPPGSFPLFVWHDNAAETGVASDDTSSGADSTTAIAASAANVSFCILGQEAKGMCGIKYLYGYFQVSFT